MNPSKEQPRTTPTGFAIIELVVLVVVLVFVCAVLLPSLMNMRREARLASDLGKFHSIAGWMDAYATDFQDHFAIFSWQGGETYAASLPSLGTAQDDVQASANQAIEIIRTVGNRPDITQITGWIPHVSYGHLVLAQYANLPLPSTDFVSAGDVHRTNWTKDPQHKFDQNFWLPNQPWASSINKRWPYSSSFELNPAIWDRSAVGWRVSNGPSSANSYATPSGIDLGPHARAEVRHPSHKAVMYDQYAWHFDRGGHFFWFDEARIPTLLADGHASVQAIADANLSMNPNLPTVTNAHTQAAYTPSYPAGASSVLLTDHIRWTRAGLKGRDFGGPEVVENP